MPICQKWKEKIKVTVRRKIFKLPDRAPLLHLKLFSPPWLQNAMMRKIIGAKLQQECQAGVSPQKWVETFHELLLLIVVPMYPSGSRTAKKCFDGRKSDLFLGSVLKLWSAEITNPKDNKGEAGGGSLLYCNPWGNGHFYTFRWNQRPGKILEAGSEMLSSWLQ